MTAGAEIAQPMLHTDRSITWYAKEVYIGQLAEHVHRVLRLGHEGRGTSRDGPHCSRLSQRSGDRLQATSRGGLLQRRQRRPCEVLQVLPSNLNTKM